MTPRTGCHLISGGKTLHEHLRTARMNCEYTLEEISAAAGIPLSNLHALEEGAYERLPAAVYGRNFVKQFAKMVGLNPREMVAMFDRESHVFFERQQPLPSFAKKNEAQRFLSFHPNMFRTALACSVALFVAGFLGVRLHGMLAKPDLELSFPAADMRVGENTITVSGWVSPHSTLRINGDAILSRDDGNFAETVHLQEGVNVISVRAERKFGRANEISRRIVVH